MASCTVGLGTLRRLSTLATDGHPVLSVYLALGQGGFERPRGRDAGLDALLGSAGANGADAGAVCELVRVRPELLRGGRGLAIFSSARSGVLETVALPDRVEPVAVLDTIVWLEPLVAMISSDDWGVMVLSRRVARLFRGGPRGLVEFVTIETAGTDGYARRGWAQTPVGPGSDDRIVHLVGRAAERMLRANQRRTFDRLVLVAPDELWPVIHARLHPDLLARLTAHVVLDLERAGAKDIRRAVAAVVEEAELAREQQLLRRLSSALRTSGPAAAGVDEVLASLEQRRVETVMVAEGAQLIAGLCPRCGRVSSARERRCPLDGAPLVPVDAVDHTLEEAHHQRVNVVMLRHQTGGLRDHGSIAALLHG